VAFNTPVSREYLRGLGRYAAPGHAGQLARRIIELLANPHDAKQLGAALRRRAEAEYSWDTASEKLQLVYDEVSPQLAVDGQIS
jgi:glycosyltransferase involved in cell wall biosynthesis